MTERTDVCSTIAQSAHVDPFEPSLIAAIEALDTELFRSADSRDLGWALTHMPDPSVHAAYDDGVLVGFKLGHALSRLRYYSLVGGVRAGFRRRGIARQLLIAQHEWVRDRGYTSIETTTITENLPMLRLNLECGFEIVGTSVRDGRHRVILQKRF